MKTSPLASLVRYVLPSLLFAARLLAGGLAISVEEPAGTPINTGAVFTAGATAAYDLNEIPPEAQSAVTAVAVSAEHTVVLRGDGSVFAWGRSDSGQCDVPVEAQSGVTAIAAGQEFTLALKSDGRVLAWGANQYGQTEVPEAAKAGVVAVSAGDGHVLALKSDGSIVAWGQNGYGQCDIPAEAASGMMAVAAAGQRSVGLRNDGRVIVWGGYPEYEPAVPEEALSGVAAIAANFWHTLALKTDGSLVTWGIISFDGWEMPEEAHSGGVAVAVGYEFSSVLKRDGSVVVWGPNAPPTPDLQSGALSIAAGGSQLAVVRRSRDFGPQTAGRPGVAKTFTVKNTGPVDLVISSAGVEGLEAAEFTVDRSGLPAVLPARTGIGTFTVTLTPGAAGTRRTNFRLATNDAAAPFFDLLLTGTGTPPPPSLVIEQPPGIPLAEPGTVVAWGGNGDGQSTVPEAARSGITAIAAGERHTLALKKDGSVVAWGYNFYGQTNVPEAAQMGATAIAAGGYNSFVVTKKSGLIAWGYDFNSTSTPNYFLRSGLLALAAGDRSVIALRKEGDVLNYQGVLFSSGPCTAIAAGGVRSLAVLKDGWLLQWGELSYQDDVSGRYVSDLRAPPEAVSSVAGVAAGRYHSGVVKTDGSVIAWGKNDAGQTEVPSEAHSGVTALAAGEWHTVALKTGGRVVAWGSDAFGQTDVPATAQAGVVAIAAGKWHTVALVDATPVNFPNQPAGSTSAARKFLLKNTGTPSLTLTSATLVSGDVSEFTVASESPATTLPGGGQFTLGVTFHPSSAGPKSALLRIVTTDPVDGTRDILLSGEGFVPTPAISIQHSNGTPVPAPGRLIPWKAGLSIPGLNTDALQADVAAISSTTYSTLVLKRDGTVVAAGHRGLGLGEAPLRARTGVVAVATGYVHSVVLRGDGEVVAWGDASDGRTNVPSDARSGVMSIAAGRDHTLALRADGRVVAWGLNTYGQTTVPTAALSGVISVAAGDDHSLALKSDSSVVAWGKSFLGVGLVRQDPGPRITSISAGGDNSLAIRADGTPAWWGAPPEGLNNVKAMVANSIYRTSYALKNDGSVVAWTNSGPMVVPAALRSGVLALPSGTRDTFFVGMSPPVVFPGQPVGMPGAPMRFSVTNTGDAPLTLSGVILSGESPQDFSVDRTGRPDRFEAGMGGEAFAVTFTPTAPGARRATLRVLSNDPVHPGFDIALTGNETRPLEDWMLQYFNTTAATGPAAPDADPNANGIPNLIEYALGGNPLEQSPGPGILPRFSRSSTGQPQLTFSRRIDRTDITLTVQAQQGLAGNWINLAWSVAGGPFETGFGSDAVSESVSGDLSTVRVTATPNISTWWPTPGAGFLRVKVDVPQSRPSRNQDSITF